MIVIGTDPGGINIKTALFHREKGFGRIPAKIEGFKIKCEITATEGTLQYSAFLAFEDL
jgi:hypothetical protein